MPDDDRSQAQTQRTTDLARIRDNQRRSRARRKDYLHELETKHRHCEQHGAAASAEVQAAARRVLDENRRLRALLRRHGVPDDDVDGPRRDTDHLPPPAAALEGLLGVRRPCRPPASRSSSAASGGRVAGLREPEPPRQTPPSAAPVARSKNGLAPLQPAVLYAQNSGPAPTTSPAPTATRFTASESFSPAVPHGYQSGAVQGPTYDPPVENSRHVSSWLDVQPSPLGTSSCRTVASAIRTIRPELGCELEEELGCAPGVGECAVPNGQIFNIMDRY